MFIYLFPKMERFFLKKSIQEGDVDQIKLKDGAIINAENCLKKQL